MKTVYIHIGLHKTGTTTIQDFLLANIELLAKYGVFIPFVHRNHNLTCWVNNDKKGERRKNQWERLIKKMEENDLPTVVLSSEFFSKDIAEIDDWHMHFDRVRELGHAIKFIFYLRRPDKRFESLFVEAVKGGVGINNIIDFPTENMVDNWKICERITARFGREALIIKKFEDEIAGGLIDGFLRAAGVSGIEVNESDYASNRKPMLDQLRAIQYASELYGVIYKSLFTKERYKRKAIKKWANWFMKQTNSWQDVASYTLLPAYKAKEILEEHKVGQQRIADAFFDGDLSHLYTTEVEINNAPSLEIGEMRIEHIAHMLRLLKHVRPILDSGGTVQPMHLHDPQIDVPHT